MAGKKVPSKKTAAVTVLPKSASEKRAEARAVTIKAAIAKATTTPGVPKTAATKATGTKAVATKAAAAKAAAAKAAQAKKKKDAKKKPTPKKAPPKKKESKEEAEEEEDDDEETEEQAEEALEEDESDGGEDTPLQAIRDVQKAQGEQVHEIYKALKEFLAKGESQAKPKKKAKPALLTAASDSDEDAANGDQKKAPGVAKDAYTGSWANKVYAPIGQQALMLADNPRKDPRFVQWVADRRTTPLIAPFQMRLQFMNEDVMWRATFRSYSGFLGTGENADTEPDGYPEGDENYMRRTILQELISMYFVCRSARAVASLATIRGILMEGKMQAHVVSNFNNSSRDPVSEGALRLITGAETWAFVYLQSVGGVRNAETNRFLCGDAIMCVHDFNTQQEEAATKTAAEQQQLRRVSENLSRELLEIQRGPRSEQNWRGGGSTAGSQYHRSVSQVASTAPSQPLTRVPEASWTAEEIKAKNMRITNGVADGYRYIGNRCSRCGGRGHRFKECKSIQHPKFDPQNPWALLHGMSHGLAGYPE